MNKKTTLNYRKFGESGSPLIAIHGLFGSLENLGMVTRELAADFQVYAIDLPNHGHSSHIDNMTLSVMANIVKQWMDTVGIESAHCLGHSLGGKVCMEMSLMFPDALKSLIIADIAPVQYPSRHDLIFEGLRAVDLATIDSRSRADQQMQPYIPDVATRYFLLKNLVKVDDHWRWRMNLPGIEASYSHLLGENRSDLPPYQGDVLFIKGGDSDYLLPEYRSQILKCFPKAAVKEIQHTGHWLHAEKPTIFNAIVKRFLASQVAA